MKAPVDMMECDLPNNTVYFRWGSKEIKVMREKNGELTVRVVSGHEMTVQPHAANTITVKVKDF